MQPQPQTTSNQAHHHPNQIEPDTRPTQIRSPVKSNFLKRRSSKSTYNNENKEPQFLIKSSLFPESTTINNSTENKTLSFTPGKSKPDWSFPDALPSSKDHTSASKPPESPYTAFCRGLQLSPGPLPSVSPITYGKNSLFFGGNEVNNFISPSPLNLHLGPDNISSPIAPRKSITKLDFNNKFILFKSNRDEISIEQDDTNDKYESPHFDSGLSPSPQFSFPVKKSIYSNTSLIPTQTRTADIFSQNSNAGHEDNTTVLPTLSNNHTQHEEQENQHLDDVLKTPSPTRKLVLDAANSFGEKNEKGQEAMQNKQSFGASHVTVATSDFNTANSSLKSSVGKANKMEEEEATEQQEDTAVAAVKDGSGTAAKKKVCCNCKKSRCLKLYCDCFARGTGCTKDCNCQNCLNNEENADERQSAMASTLERNPIAFQPKVNSLETPEKVELKESQKARHIKGCNCKKSGCLKKYCECYQAGAKCTEVCKCDGCKNMDPMASKRKAQIYGVYSSGGCETHDKSSVNAMSPSTEKKENARVFLSRFEGEEDENSSIFDDGESDDEMKKQVNPRKQLFGNNKSPKAVDSVESEKCKSTSKNRDRKRKGSTVSSANAGPLKTPSTHGDGKKVFEYGQSPEKQQSLSGGRTRRNIRPFSHLNPDEYDLGK